jgi:O-antigen chain-terminating methyltransferase
VTSASSPDFYSAFENKYRGSSALVTERLRIYLPLVLPLAQEQPAMPWLDIGCGRGEWLQLLTQHSIACQGIDMHESFVQACLQQSLQVQKAEAIAWLQAQPHQSFLGLSGFHIAEHLSFQDLQVLLQEAIRVLVPGGLLILETPNPENLLVGASYFYLDPTHQRPLPRQLLTFMAEHAGFARVKHMGLQEEARLTALPAQNANSNLANLQLIDVLAGVSPDQAIVAQTPTLLPMPPEFEAAWQQHHGVSLHELAERYEALQKSKLPAEIQAQLADQQRSLDVLHAQLEAMQQSKTWRLANLFRQIYRALRSLLPRS